MVNNVTKNKALIAAATVGAVGITATIGTAVAPQGEDTKNNSANSDSSKKIEKAVKKEAKAVDLNNKNVATPAQEEAAKKEANNDQKMVALSNIADQDEQAKKQESNASAQKPQAAPAQKTIKYTIESGDTLFDIAEKFGVSVETLTAANGGSTFITSGSVLEFVPNSNQAGTNESENNTQGPVENQNQTQVQPETQAPVENNNNNQAPAQPEVQAPTENQNAQVQQPQEQAPATPQTNQNTSSVTALALELAQKGIPYVWGGGDLSGFDCSGLTSYVYQQTTGKYLPHNTVMQEGYVTQKAVSEAQPGDLLFWGDKGATYHTAIYLGNNQYVAAPYPGVNVQVETISSAFMPSFAGSVN